MFFLYKCFFQKFNERYKIIKVFGEGGFGRAILIEDKITKLLQVMKK